MDMHNQSLQAVTENLMTDEANRDLFRAAELGDAQAQYAIAEQYFPYAWDADIAKETVKWLECASQQGHAEAQFCLALHSHDEFCEFDYGPLLQNDFGATLKWMRAAAAQGHFDAIDHMILIHGGSLAEVPRDANEVAKWEDQLAKLSLLDLRSHLDSRRAETALFRLIDLLKRRACQISKEDEAFVVDCVRVEAESGDRSAQRTLGNLHAHGLVWLQADTQEAVKWHSLAVTDEEEGPRYCPYDVYELTAFRQNAERCGVALQRLLGQLFEQAELREYDMTEAARWYELAAAQGDSLAQFEIASMYHEGNGVAKSDETALKWYRKSAEQGNPRGQYILGLHYDFGRGLDQSHRLARRWYLAAAKQGHKACRRRCGIPIPHQHARNVRSSSQRRSL